MAILHASTIRPTKDELLVAELGPSVEQLGSYRFDDPDGEVGVEGFLVRTDDGLRHLLLTYRGAPLERTGVRLVSTMDHSVLGPRWVYDGATDPVAVGCLRRALRGEQSQAELEVWDGGEQVGAREPTARLSVVGPTAPSDAPEDDMRILREPTAYDVSGPDPGRQAPALVATWDGGAAVVAAAGEAD